MTAINDEFFDAVLKDMEGQEPIYLPTAFWRQALARIGDQLRNGGIESFRNLDGPGAFFVPTYLLESLSCFDAEMVAQFEEQVLSSSSTNKKRIALLDQLKRGHHLALGDYRAFKAGDRPEKPPFLTRCYESDVGNPSGQVSFDGQTYSRAMLNYINGLVFLKQHVDTESIRNVLEIGGGFGTLGEILLRDDQREYLYVDCDIPPTIYAASYYLSALYGDRFMSTLDVGSQGPINVNNLSCNASVLSTWQLPRLVGTFDLFVNFISFQEMEPNVVDNYVSHASRLQCKYALIRNLREGKNVRSASNPVGVETPVTSETYDSIFGQHGYTLVATNVHPYGFQTADGFHSELRLYKRS